LNFFSEGKNKGSTFFFELPLYSSKASGLIAGPAVPIVESNTMEVVYINANNFGDLETGAGTWRANQTLLPVPSSSSRSHVSLTAEVSTPISRRETNSMQRLLEAPPPPRVLNDGDVRVESIDDSLIQEHKATTRGGNKHLLIADTLLFSLVSISIRTHSRCCFVFRIACVHQS
jgi:hypothetical protein